MIADDFADMANEPCAIRRRDRTGSDAGQGLPSIEELLVDAFKTRRSDKRLDHAVENNWKESDSPKYGWGKSRGDYIGSVCC